MKLTRVTITGADESVQPRELATLSSEFPFVEWGVLLSAKHQGNTPRYPSANWLGLLAAEKGYASLALSGHLCGEYARNVWGGMHLQWRPWRDMAFGRLQVNGFTDFVDGCDVGAKFTRAFLGFTIDNSSCEFILQCQSKNALAHARHLAGLVSNVRSLWDRSGGRGLVEGHWPQSIETELLGYAGGIGPDNLVSVVEKLSELPPRLPAFWIDMESGVRTDDKFDLTKVRRVLELAKPFVEVA